MWIIEVHTITYVIDKISGVKNASVLSEGICFFFICGYNVCQITGIQYFLINLPKLYSVSVSILNKVSFFDSCKNIHKWDITARSTASVYAQTAVNCESQSTE